jgi:hypothetical protein
LLRNLFLSLFCKDSLGKSNQDSNEDDIEDCKVYCNVKYELAEQCPFFLIAVELLFGFIPKTLK